MNNIFYYKTQLFLIYFLTDKEEDRKIISNEPKTIKDFYIYTDDDEAKMHKQNAFVDNNADNQVKNKGIPEVYIDDNDENQVKNIGIPDVYIDDNNENQVKNIGIPDVYIDDDNENQVINMKAPKVYNDENQVKNIKISEVYNDENNENQFKTFKTPEVYIDNDCKMLKNKNNKKKDYICSNKDTGVSNITKSKIPSNENSKQHIKAQNYEVYEDKSENDDGKTIKNPVKETSNNVYGSSTFNNNQDVSIFMKYISMNI